MTFTKSSIQKASAPNAWCIRPGKDGGMKLTYSKVVMTEKITDPKKTFGTIAATPRTSYHAELFSNKVSQGIEIELQKWTMHNDILYVSDGTKVYKLLLMKVHGKRIDTYAGITTRLGQCQRITRVYM